MATHELVPDGNFEGGAPIWQQLRSWCRIEQLQISAVWQRRATSWPGCSGGGDPGGWFFAA